MYFKRQQGQQKQQKRLPEKACKRDVLFADIVLEEILKQKNDVVIKDNRDNKNNKSGYLKSRVSVMNYPQISYWKKSNRACPLGFSVL